MPQGVAIRVMRLEDLDRVMEIAAGVVGAPRWSRAGYVAAIQGDTLPSRVALVGEVDGVIAGFVVVGVVGPQAELESIVVAEEVQGRGIGAALLGAVVRDSRSAGAEEMILEVRASNLRAGRLYEKAGFREVGRRRGYYRDPVEDAALLNLILGK